MEARREPAGEQEIHPQTVIGRVCLVTGRADELSIFYRRQIGLGELPRRDGALWLGAGERTLLVLQQNPEARRAPGGVGEPARTWFVKEA